MNDRYIHTDECVARLVAEWRKHGKIIIAVDFDDTLYDFHQRGDTFDNVAELLRLCAEQGAHICAFTASPPEKYAMVKARFTELGIPLASINENPIPLPFGRHGKMYYNILLDDRAGLGMACIILNLALIEMAKHSAPNGAST